MNGTNTTYYLNDPSSGAMSEKLVSSGVTSWHDYLLADGKIVAERISGGSPVGTPTNWGSANWGAFQWSGSPAPAWLYFVLNHLGSIPVITDQGGGCHGKAATPPDPASMRTHHQLAQPSAKHVLTV